MNNTNRAANRLILLLVGIVFLALGAAAVTLIVWPAAADYWTSAGKAAQSWIDHAIETTMTGLGALSWIALAVLAVIVLLIVLLIIALTGIGGRRSRTVLRSTGQENPLGRVTVQEAFASDALQHSLGTRNEILTSSVSANDIRKRPVMHISVTPRKNTSPRQLMEDIDLLVTNLAALTGRDVSTYVSMHSGIRAALAHDQSRVT
ncbi:hypothetical protein [Agromyces laixinhei]|uniref:hypothetical protein n=1 Tax=Agromyces laixinhei TaxID=2585717 RepID=UPI0012ECE2EC|nr:hypothetical protein [Agromyces laixinhei]